jgi:hypothetical protein
LSPEARKYAHRWEEWFDLVGSLDRSHVVVALGDQAPHLEQFILEIHVPVMALQMLLSRWYVTHIDLLVVDAEGHDLRIVRQALELGSHPEIILFEHSNLSSAERESALSLLKADYDIRDVGIDFLCMNKRSPT